MCFVLLLKWNACDLGHTICFLSRCEFWKNCLINWHLSIWLKDLEIWLSDLEIECIECFLTMHLKIRFYLFFCVNVHVCGVCACCMSAHVCCVCMLCTSVWEQLVGSVLSFHSGFLKWKLRWSSLVAKIFTAYSSHWLTKCFNCLILQFIHNIDALSFVVIVVYIHLAWVISTVIICKVT